MNTYLCVFAAVLALALAQPAPPAELGEAPPLPEERFLLPGAYCPQYFGLAQPVYFKYVNYCSNHCVTPLSSCGNICLAQLYGTPCTGCMGTYHQPCGSCVYYNNVYQPWNTFAALGGGFGK